MDKQSDKWANNLYDGLSGIGAIKSSIILIVGWTLYVLSLVMGFYLISEDNEEDYLRITGYIIDSNCVKASAKNDIEQNNYKCTVNIKYNIDNKEYYKNIFMTGHGSIYIKDEPIEIMVLKKDYNNVKVAEISNSTLGSISISVGTLILIMAYINNYLARNFKIFAATQGASTLAGLFI